MKVEIEDACEMALDALEECGIDTDDAEHAIYMHSSQLPDYYRKLCAAVERAKTLLRRPCDVG